MLKGLLSRVVGDPNEREVQKLRPMVEAINALELEMGRRTDAELRSLTDRFRARLAAGEKLDDLLVEAFAAAREAAKRTVDMRPFDVQLIGGIVLHQGKVAEMKTGEGKTLVATMPVYLNALSGRGVHLVTVNDYLARRDVLWMGPIYHLLGLKVGLLQAGAEGPSYLYDPSHQRDPYPGLRPVLRREAYAADVTYGTNNEFGFDYLRDNLALALEYRVQRPLYYAIVDEVDNIFIDEARTPLIISGPSDEPVEEYNRFAVIARKLERNVHYELDEKERSVFLTEEGLAVVEQDTGIENIYDEANYRYVHYMQQALKAQVLFLEGRDYIRERKRIVLIDPHTGRLMHNRRLSEGLHQAIEAKEGVPIRPRDVTSATITIQNYFRMYEKLAGMSGTALTEAEEFFKIYRLDVTAIPTNQPVVRQDHPDVVYRSEEAKFRAVAREILTCFSQDRPVLVGTTSVEMSERLSSRLSGERLQMAALGPRVAYALQDGRAELDRAQRASMRETMNTSLETMNPLAWRRLLRDLDLNPNALDPDNLAWITDYLNLPNDPDVAQTLERAFREGIPHEILNAKEHTREAAIIARAGEPGAVTIATNMAGRGVDIKLGGELQDEVIHKAHEALEARELDSFTATRPQMDSAVAEVSPQYAKRRARVLAVGGLHILGTERHEARRIDNQLRGRSGRQGEPGSSRFYLSLEDDLMRRFGRKEMLSKLMEQIGDDFPIEHGLVTKTIERAQTSVEGYNFDIRKHLLEYDDVLNRQRETIYGERLRILRSEDLRADVWRMLETQVDEYVQKSAAGPDQERLAFSGLDDIVPLMLQAPNAPFQGPLAFGSHLTAFPPFTISFLADQFVDQNPDQVNEALHSITRQAAIDYGQQIRLIVSEVARTTLEKYDEQLGRYQALLDEKIDDYVQLVEERGQPVDPQRLAQHLERTFPAKLSRPSPGRDSHPSNLDDWRGQWLEELQVEFHRQTCTGLIERVQIRLPMEVRLDRLRPGLIPPGKLGEEAQRVVELAAKQPRDDQAAQRLKTLPLPAQTDGEKVLQFVNTIKEASQLELGRLDRLMGHVLATKLDALVDRYIGVLSEDHGRIRRDLEQLQASLVEGKKGGRIDHLVGALHQLNDLVHLEIPDLADLMTLAVAHEYDKWAQRQIFEIELAAQTAPLSDTGWTDIAEHLLNTHYTQKLVYDRDHQRRAVWATRLPLSSVAHGLVAIIGRDRLRDQILASLHWALEQRERSWGQQELRRWGYTSVKDWDEEAYDGLLRYLGKRELGDLQDAAVEDLPAELYDRLRFTLALRRFEEQNVSLGELPQAEGLLTALVQDWQEEILDTPFTELGDDSQKQILESLRQAGYLDDHQARSRLMAQPIHDWDDRTRQQVAGYWGRWYIEHHKNQPLRELDREMLHAAVGYLQRIRRFVDEERVQRFLVHQRVDDLPLEVEKAALMHIARARLDRFSKRKISNIDVSNRQAILASLQRIGLLNDESKKAELMTRSASLDSLDGKAKAGFGTFLARRHLVHHRLSELDQHTRDETLQSLKQGDLLLSPDRLASLPGQRLAALDSSLAAQLQEELVGRLKADLASKTMDELPASTRKLVHATLDRHNYFVDPEKVEWYERKTLAQLPTDLLRGLERYLGQLRLESLDSAPFRDLAPDSQASVLAFLDGEKLLSDRTTRLRLTQTGALAELPADVRDKIAHHLGRQWLVQIRDQRPANLAADQRDLVWTFLRSQGYFVDQFKEELFSYQRLDEFDVETHLAVERGLTERVVSDLQAQAIGQLPPDLQAEIQARLRQGDHLLDPVRVQMVLELPADQLPADLREAVEAAVGAHLLGGLNARPIVQFPPETQEALWCYLDEAGYFVDEKKRAQILDRRLADLGSEVLEALVLDLATHLQDEVSGRFVSDLDDELRQGLREALETLGYFESEEIRAQVLGQSLGNLRREELDQLATVFGIAYLAANVDRCLSDLPGAEPEAILDYLQAQDWFLNPAQMDRLRGQRIRDLEPDTRQNLLAALQRQQMDGLRHRHLLGLDRDTRHQVRQMMFDQGVRLEESRMRSLQREAVSALDPEVYRELLRDLGSRVVDDWGTADNQGLDASQQALLSAFLGRRIMSRIERRVLLHVISRLWIDYLTDIEDLRRGIGLEAYGQRDPLVEYKRRAFELFEELTDNVRRTVVRSIFRQPPTPLRAL